MGRWDGGWTRVQVRAGGRTPWTYAPQESRRSSAPLRDSERRAGGDGRHAQLLLLCSQVLGHRFGASCERLGDVGGRLPIGRGRLQFGARELDLLILGAARTLELTHAPPERRQLSLPDRPLARVGA